MVGGWVGWGGGGGGEGGGAFSGEHDLGSLGACLPGNSLKTRCSDLVGFGQPAGSNYIPVCYIFHKLLLHPIPYMTPDFWCRCKFSCWWTPRAPPLLCMTPCYHFFPGRMFVMLPSCLPTPSLCDANISVIISVNISVNISDGHRYFDCRLRALHLVRQ